MFKKEYLAKMLVIFGMATLVAWITNFIALLIPFQFKVVKWVYLLSQEISEKSIFPLIGILAIIGGVYLCNSAREENKQQCCKCAVWTQRLCAVLCVVFFAGLITLTVVYSLAIKPIQNDIKTQINNEANKVRSQVTMMVQSNPKFGQGNLQRGLAELDDRVTKEIKRAKKDLITNSVKIIVNLLSYAFAYLVFAIYLIKILIKKKCTVVNTEN